MSEHAGRSLSGELLAIARRAASIALLIESVPDLEDPVQGQLPPRADILSVTNAIGWPGDEIRDLTIDPLVVATLAGVVDVLLAVAFAEAAQTIRRHLSSDGPRSPDALLASCAALSRLALYLSDGSADARLGESPPLDGISGALRGLADDIWLPMWVADADFCIEWANPALAAVLGTNLSALEGSQLLAWVAPDDRDRLAQILHAARLEQRNWSAEVGMMPSIGPDVRLLSLAAPRRDQRGLLTGWTGLCFNISANPSLSERLRGVTMSHSVAGATLGLLLRQLPAMVWATDLDLICTFSHGAVFESLGALPNQLVGRSVAEIVGTDDQSHPALTAHRRALDGLTAHYIDSFAGREFDATVEPLIGPDGSVFGCVGLAIERRTPPVQEVHN